MHMIPRISIVSGFMPHEVSGQLAFTYMHKDDVRWVMIALRQSMFNSIFILNTHSIKAY